MAQTAQTFYLGHGLSGAPVSPSGITLPGSNPGTWSVSNAASTLANSGGMFFTSGTTQTATATLSVASTNTNGGLIASYASDRLAAQAQIAAANWTVAYAVKSSSATRTFTARVALYLMTNAGAVRTTIVAAVAVGASRASTSELTIFSATVAGSAFTPQDGDYLYAELGVAVPSGTITPQIFDGGTTAITVDNTATSDAQASIIAPVALTMKGDWTLYSALGRSLPAGLVAPAGALDTWGVSSTSAKGAGAKYLSAVAQAGEQTVAVAGVAASTTALLAQCLSDALAAGVKLPNWGVNLGFALAASSASAAWTGSFALELVNGATGAVRVALVNTADVGASRSGTTAERTCYSAQLYKLIAASATAGDYLAMELGADNFVGATADFTLHSDGTTAIVADNAATSDAKAFIALPYALYFQSTFTWSQLVENAVPAEYLYRPEVVGY